MKKVLCTKALELSQGFSGLAPQRKPEMVGANDDS